MTQPVRSYAVIGAREGVWPVAAMLARQLPEGVEIAVAEEAEAGDETAIVPLADAYFEALGIGTAELVLGGAHLALGYQLEGFVGETLRTILAPSGELPAIGGLALHHILRRVACEAKAFDRFAELYEGFRFCARAAADGRMALPGDAPDSPLAMLGPLVVIARSSLADLLERATDNRSISRCATVEDALEADFVIDLRKGTASDTAADLPMLAGVQIEAKVEPGAMPVYRLSGRGEEARFADPEPWQGNRLRLGPASASLGPLFAADSRLLLFQVMHLTQCLPADEDMSAEARRFNHLHRQSVERLYELAAAPVHLNQRADAAFQSLREIDPPEGLAVRIEQFRSRGRMPSFDGEVADRQFWIDTLLAFGVVPERHDRRADGFDARQLDGALGTIRAQLDQTLAAMPQYSRFMQRFGDI